MCGISGLYTQNPILQSEIETVQRMNDLQKHRGPDDEDIYVGQNCIIGHRRLAIIDLSRDGRQPFVSPDGHLHLIFNGEIYNYIELRQELMAKGHVFKTKTDTEVLLHCYMEYGEQCLSKLNGMFAIVIYDTRDHSVFFARDRVGVKPLYYLRDDDRFLFASEVKALHHASRKKLTVNDQALFDYLCFNRTDVFDETFTKEIKRIPKGHLAKLKNGQLEIKQWWNPEDYLKPKSKSFEEFCKDIREIFTSAVHLRMRSDVPVGSSLSGGVDSTILVGALFQTYPNLPKFKTFTASFPNHPVDETKYVDILNKKYPFENFRIYPNAEKALQDIKKFVYTNDEPTTSPSFYSQYEVMRKVKEEGVTVLLDGQGGDESFAGYHYFHGFWAYGLYKKGKLFTFAKELWKILRRKQDKTAWQTLAFQLLPNFIRKKLLAKTLPHIQSKFFKDYIDSSKIFTGFFNANSLNENLVRHFQYKLEHLLRMEDRNSMAFSIEARVPYLDYRLIEYVLGVPEEFKIKDGETKFIQKKSLGDFSIPEIIDRKDKFGFETPVDVWMKQPAWQDLTNKNFAYLKMQFPHIFLADANLPTNTYEIWKINQLAIWHQLFFKEN